MDPITTYFRVKEAGWKRIASKEAIKTAFTVKDLLSAAKTAVPYIGLGLGAGSIGYNILKDRKIEGLENKRELVGAMNDTVVRQRIGDIYQMAGYPEPPMPLAVSKEISHEYKKVMDDMSKGAMEKEAISPWAMNAFKQRGFLKNIGQRFMQNPNIAKGVEAVGRFTTAHPKLTNMGTAAVVGLGTAYVANKIQDRGNRRFMASMGVRNGYG
jgi:hypothetical protein